MKTLDEVIDELEDEGLFTDALHYLQEYRQLVQNLGEVANPPLTWDELKNMQGKPVWFTDKSSPYITVTSWMLIHYYYVTSTGEEGIFAHDFTGGTAKIINKDYGEGKTWQAYRKER